MSKVEVKRWIHNINRLLIVSLTLAGLLMNGYQHSDMIFFLSVLIWVCLQEFDRLFALVVFKVKFKNKTTT